MALTRINFQYANNTEYTMSDRKIEQHKPFYIYLNFVNRDIFDWADNHIERELNKQFELPQSGLKLMKLSSFEFLNFYLDKFASALMVFTNFPPDSTYHNRFEMNVNSGILYADANSYEKSKHHLSSLANRFPTVPFHVLSGAPDDVISDGEIICLSNHANIFVTRKRSLLHEPGSYEEALINYYKATIAKALRNHSNNNM